MFSSSDVSNYHDQVRALCAGLDTDELADTTIDLYVYGGRIETVINTRYPNYSALTASKKKTVGISYCYLTAASLCRTYCKGRNKYESDNKSTADRDKIDWDALADELEGVGNAGLSEVDDLTITATSGLILAPSSENPSTLETQSLKQETV